MKSLFQIGLLLIGLSVLPTAAGAQAPGTLLVSNGTSQSDPESGTVSVDTTIGPYSARAHVFLTAFGTARAFGPGKVSFRAGLRLVSTVYSENNDSNYASNVLSATANYEFILAANTKVKVTAFANSFPADANVQDGDIKLTYRAVAIRP